MAFDIATARVKAGLLATDSTQDLLLQMGLDAALAIAENYCDRLFTYKTERLYYYDNTGKTLQVKRYPIETVISITSDKTGSVSSKSDYYVHHNFGLITFKNNHGNYLGYGNTVEVNVTAGYKTFPADLELALWGIFSVVYASLSAPAGGAAVTTQAGTISSITVPDVGTVSFAAPGAAGATAALAGSAAYGQYGMFFHLLDPYRSIEC